ncbi:hypothetical protein V8J82_02745 [Gymnodinialimonas sp. 2305UL16-5]|uniref:hypothetical protein n=1 Tax=Gymnodinialimonas mytili TaxID=3126503 RepID=UPI00309E2C11
MTARRNPGLRHENSSCCGRQPDAKEIAVEAAGLDRFEDITLQIFRYFFQAFACPQSQGWVHALEVARSACGEHGASVAHKVLDAMRAVRTTRTSTFMFNSPSCPGCAAILSEHERRLMSALASIRRGRVAPAQLELMMLCEGNDVSGAISAFMALSDAMPDPLPAETGL